MEAEVSVEPQVTFGLLSEYADKLRSLSELCIKYHRRKLILEVLFYSFTIILTVLMYLYINIIIERPGPALSQG